MDSATKKKLARISESQYVTIICSALDGQGDFKFKVKRSAELIKLKKLYAKHKRIPFPNDLRFVFMNKYIQDHQTPDFLEMEDVEEIDVRWPAISGGFCF